MTQSTDFFPAPQRPGSNAIGQFQIGVSPIGTIDFNWQDTFIAQYANSLRLISMVASFADATLMAPELDAFYDDVWNILTAQGEGLDVWGRILVIGRALTVDAGTYFGFEEALPTSVGFNQEGFYSGPPSSSNYLLTDPAYRLLLLAKAAFNICEGNIPAMNQILLILFPNRGNAFVQEGSGLNQDYFGFQESGDTNATGFNQSPFYSGESFDTMAMQYIFEFLLTPVEIAIVEQSGVLPTPSGVTAYVNINP